MKTYNIELLVKLKIADTVALTAKNTLQRDLGYESVLMDLQREECWVIQAEAENVQAAEEFGKELATVTKIFVNPNKHTYALRVSESVKPSPQERGEKESYELRVIISYRQDEKAVSARDTLRNTYGYGDKIKDVGRSMLWKLILNAKNPDDARKIAEEITLASGMDRGLLANPHSQTYLVL